MFDTSFPYPSGFHHACFMKTKPIRQTPRFVQSRTTRRGASGHSSQRHLPACSCSSSSGLSLNRRPSTHQALQTQISPCWLLCFLRSSLDTESRMLVWYYVVLVIWVEWLMLWRDVDLFLRELGGGKRFEEVDVVRSMEVDVGEGGIAGLSLWSALGHVGYTKQLIPW